MTPVACVALSEFLDDFVVAAKQLDDARPIGRSRTREYRPGIGPLQEAELIDRVLPLLRTIRLDRYREAKPVQYPGSRTKLDLLIPDLLAIEFKLIRPFGDNGVEAEHWSENAIHPYPGNVSAVGDCLKLRDSTLGVAKAVVIFGFEHEQAVVPLDPAIRLFEYAAMSIHGVQLSSRDSRHVAGLIHPVHQVMRVFGWSILPS